ncbi:MAG: cobalt ECF transporter T component CbiQ [Desulfuromonas sp.]|jgi:cobalt/nickel transport system permease protein|nr:MAG: cobalt ECF transporter T component CbiQ [Desulfuromonas sp.]
MSRIESAALSLGTLDTLAYRDSWVHRLDPRVKLLTTLIFIIMVASFDKYSISALLPFFIFPLVLKTGGRLPTRFLLNKLLLVAPFAVLIGMFNPLIDQQPLLQIGPWAVSGGWVSFLSILLRFSLTISAALILIATCSFPGICMALNRLGTPRIFTVQLLLLYRYLFVLSEEAIRLVRGRALRSVDRRGLTLRMFAQLLSQLLLRTLDRAQRIHLAMLCRGFDGNIRVRRTLTIGRREILFLLGWSSLFILLRCYNLPQLLGQLFI